MTLSPTPFPSLIMDVIVIVITAYEALRYQFENGIPNFANSWTVCFRILITTFTCRRVGVNLTDTVIIGACWSLYS